METDNIYKRLSEDPTSDDYLRMDHPSVEGYGWVQQYDAEGNESEVILLYWSSIIGWYDGQAQVFNINDDDYVDDEQSPTSVLSIV